MTIANPPITRRALDGPARLSFAQHQLWLSHELRPDGGALNIPVGFEVCGPFDDARFARALTEIVRRHEALRTSFVVVDGGPLQQIGSPSSLRVSRANLEALRPEDARRAAILAVHRLAAAPFDVARAPLVRAVVCRLSPRASIVGIVVHHLVFDGWSASILLQEIDVLYDAFGREQPSPLRDLPFQYADYAEWQREQRGGRRWTRAVRYWTEQLRRPTGSLDDLFDRAPALERCDRTESIAVAVDERTSAALKSATQKRGATLFVAAAAAFATVLHRYTGHAAVALGTFAASRRQSALDPLIGLFVNTLPLPIDCSGDPPWTELVDRVRNACVEAFDHDDVPFEYLVDAARATAGAVPLIQAVVSLKTFPKTSARSRPSSLAITPLSLGTQSSFPLWLSLDESGALTGSLKYDPDLFAQATARRIAADFEAVLIAAIAEPARRLSAFPLSGDDLACEGASTAGAASPTPHAVDQLVREQAQRTPERVAVVCGDHHVTYAALVNRAERAATAFMTLGVAPEMRLAVCMEPSIERLTTLLAAMIAGAGYVPLDPAHPVRRLAAIVEDAQPHLIVTDARSRDRVVATAVPTMMFEALQLREAPSPAAVVSRADPQGLCYLLYTSGSTGTPKGVQVQHRSVVNLLGAVRDSMGIGEHDVVAATTTLSFDIAALELYLPLTVGARVVVVARDVRFDLAALFAEQSVTVAQATPTEWRMHVEADVRCPTVFCGGERLTRELADALARRSASVWNLYGPTETTIWSSAHRVATTDRGEPSIGRPLANTWLFVLNRDGRRVPPGVRGELHIGGDGVARGYWRRPRLTAVRFVPDPFSGRPGARLYRTGDVVRAASDGSFTFVERSDLQVKLRGHRLELGDVEAALRRCAGVAAAAATIRRTASGDDQLVGYVVSAEPLVLEDCRRDVEQWLPPALVPGRLVQIPTLPKTLNGKLDRGALPSPPDDPEPDAGAPFSSATMAAVAAIWSSLLERERLDAHDDFFTLGGHSLLGTRMLARIRQAFEVQLPLRTLFDHPTLGAFVAELEARLQGSEERRSSVAG